MLTTMKQLIERNGLKKEETIYEDESDEVLNFKLTVGDFFVLLSGIEQGKNFAKIYRFHQCVEALKVQRGFTRISEQLEEMNDLAVRIKKTTKGAERKERLAELGKRKRAVREEARKIEAETKCEAAAQCGRDTESLSFFEYKNRAVITSFTDMCGLVPELKAAGQEELFHMPLLVSGLTNIKEAVDSGEPLGFVGGPCLFGIDEVLAEVRLQSGENLEFDCSCGRSCTKDKGQAVVGLEDFLKMHQGELKEIRIVNRKTGITRQEYISLKYLFAVASALNGRVVVPLPDLSYIKYMENDIGPAAAEIREQVMADFKREAFKITDLYLEVIEILNKAYPSLEVIVLHARDEKLCRTFYEKRAPYIANESFVKKLTNSEVKMEAVIDYVTMLALPYYLFGVRHVIQLDSLDETDSGRKCQKLHGNDLLLDSILYPELISGDGEKTIYNTDLAHKAYLSREEYEA